MLPTFIKARIPGLETLQGPGGWRASLQQNLDWKRFLIFFWFFQKSESLSDKIDAFACRMTSESSAIICHLEFETTKTFESMFPVDCDVAVRSGFEPFCITCRKQNCDCLLLCPDRRTIHWKQKKTVPKNLQCFASHVLKKHCYALDRKGLNKGIYFWMLIDVVPKNNDTSMRSCFRSPGWH